MITLFFINTCGKSSAEWDCKNFIVLEFDERVANDGTTEGEVPSAFFVISSLLRNPANEASALLCGFAWISRLRLAPSLEMTERKLLLRDFVGGNAAVAVAFLVIFFVGTFAAVVSAFFSRARTTNE